MYIFVMTRLAIITLFRQHMRSKIGKPRVEAQAAKRDQHEFFIRGHYISLFD
jgi:hypothetical protein